MRQRWMHPGSAEEKQCAHTHTHCEESLWKKAQVGRSKDGPGPSTRDLCVKICITHVANRNMATGHSHKMIVPKPGWWTAKVQIHFDELGSRGIRVHAFKNRGLAACVLPGCDIDCHASNGEKNNNHQDPISLDLLMFSSPLPPAATHAYTTARNGAPCSAPCSWRNMTAMFCPSGTQ